MAVFTAPWGDGILPTHTCFDDALDFIVFCTTGNQALVHARWLKLVHAICLIPRGVAGEGEPWAHAWVETTHPNRLELVWQRGIRAMDGERVYVPRLREVFYKEVRPQDVTRYSPAEADRENARTLSFGPWVPRYRELCSYGFPRTFFPLAQLMVTPGY